jgi:GNAT superfamily N-acetyltransferase
MSHNPRYYGRLIESAGLAKAKDLYAYMITEEVLRAERFARVMNALKRRAPDIEQREINTRGAAFRQDVQLMLDMFNSAWEGNWGFVKVTPEEVAAIAADLGEIVRPEFTSIASVKGKPVAFCVCVPNMNETLIRIPDGRLTTAPFSLGLSAFIDLALGRSEFRGFRTMLMGVLPEYRNKGIDALMISRIIEAGLRLGKKYCELSWILEDNVAMNSLSEKVGGVRYRTYRLYEAPLARLL